MAKDKSGSRRGMRQFFEAVSTSARYEWLQIIARRVTPLFQAGFLVSLAIAVFLGDAIIVAALELLAHEEVDMAIVDLMMPGINGLDLCRRMRFRHPAVPIVLTSAYHLSQRQLDRAEIRVLGFLPKPFEMNELVEFLRASLAASLSDAVAG